MPDISEIQNLEYPNFLNNLPFLIFQSYEACSLEFINPFIEDLGMKYENLIGSCLQSKLKIQCNKGKWKEIIIW